MQKIRFAGKLKRSNPSLLASKIFRSRFHRSELRGFEKEVSVLLHKYDLIDMWNDEVWSDKEKFSVMVYTAVFHYWKTHIVIPSPENYLFIRKFHLGNTIFSKPYYLDNFIWDSDYMRNTLFSFIFGTHKIFTDGFKCRICNEPVKIDHVVSCRGNLRLMDTEFGVIISSYSDKIESIESDLLESLSREIVHVKCENGSVFTI